MKKTGTSRKRGSYVCEQLRYKLDGKKGSPDHSVMGRGPDARAPFPFFRKQASSDRGVFRVSSILFRSGSAKGTEELPNKACPIVGTKIRLVGQAGLLIESAFRLSQKPFFRVSGVLRSSSEGPHDEYFETGGYNAAGRCTPVS